MSEDINVGAISEALNNKVDLNQMNTNAQGLSYGSGWGMPSSKYVNLTLGASGTDYTAPANGYVVIFCRQTATHGWIRLWVLNNYISFWQQPTNVSNFSINITMPVKKGHIVRTDYENITTTDGYFRFVYAEGEQ